MNIVALVGIAIISTILSVMIKKYNPEYAIAISLISGVVIFASVLSRIVPAISQIKELISATGMSAQYGMILFKSLGICFLTQFAADSCKDAGEGALASKVELAGKISIVIIALPLFEKITQTAVSLIGG